MRKNGRRRDRGASLVEFALVLPLLTLFLFGIIEFGIAYNKKQTVNSAAREGARTAAVPVNDADDVVSAATSAYQPENGDLTITITVNGSEVSGGDHPCEDEEGSTVVVLVETEHTVTIPFFGTVQPTLTGRGEFRCERTA